MTSHLTVRLFQPVRFGSRAITTVEYYTRLLQAAKPATTPEKQLTLNDMVREPKNANGEVVVRPGKPWTQVTSRYIYKPDGSLVHEIQFPATKPKEQPSEPTLRQVLPAGSIDPKLLT